MWSQTIWAPIFISTLGTDEQRATLFLGLHSDLAPEGRLRQRLCRSQAKASPENERFKVTVSSNFSLVFSLLGYLSLIFFPPNTRQSKLPFR